MLGECPYTDFQISTANYIQLVYKGQGEWGEEKEKEEEEKRKKRRKSQRAQRKADWMEIYWSRNLIILNINYI